MEKSTQIVTIIKFLFFDFLKKMTFICMYIYIYIYKYIYIYIYIYIYKWLINIVKKERKAS